MALSAVGAFDPIGETLATYANSRHRVAPLLHLACQNCADLAADEKASAILRSSYQDNVYANLRQKAVERNISDLLISHSVPFSFLKGRGLAEQLHNDPAVRQSKDVDILVAPDRSRQVIQIFNDEGYIYKTPALRGKKLFARSRQDMDIKLFKDLTFLDPKFMVPIELHCRLFAFEPNRLTADFNDSVRLRAIPSLSNSFYCLYLILHGALALWQRLKWVVDLSIMARKMAMHNRLEMMDIAKSFGCEVTVAASLLMAEEIFPGSLDDEWQVLLSTYERHESLLRIQGFFYQSLMTASDEKSMLSLKSFVLSGPADFVFPGKISPLESLFKRFMISLSIRI